MTSTTGSDRLISGVDDVLITAELGTRPSPTPDHESESGALRLLAHEMVTNPRDVLQKCAELVMELCHADSAGISILEPGGTGGVLRWHAAAGAFAPNLHGTMPREASPCGTVIERNCLLLFNGAERFFPALHGVEPRIYENLLAPWHVKGEAIGTIWAIKHTPAGQFNAEDARVLQSLARFAAAAFQMTSALDEATAERTALQQRTKALHETEARLKVVVAELQHRTRNLMGVVRSMADKTARASADLLDFRTRFRERLEALSRVQGLLSRIDEHDRIPLGRADRKRVGCDGQRGGSRSTGRAEGSPPALLHGADIRDGAARIGDERGEIWGARATGCPAFGDVAHAG